jgi:hypothetical protein
LQPPADIFRLSAARAPAHAAQHGTGMRYATQALRFRAFIYRLLSSGDNITIYILHCEFLGLRESPPFDRFHIFRSLKYKIVNRVIDRARDCTRNRLNVPPILQSYHEMDDQHIDYDTPCQTQAFSAFFRQKCYRYRDFI